MNKKAAIMSLIIIILIIISGYYVYQKSFNQQMKECTAEVKICEDGTAVSRAGLNCEFTACPIISEAEKGCLDSGGKVIGSMCCNTADDFPNTCLIGACGCSPYSSQNIKICDCAEGQCFDGNGCVGSPLSADIYCSDDDCISKQNSANTEIMASGCFKNLNECIENADWQSYQNNKFGFELKFPKTWDDYQISEGDYPDYSYAGFSFRGTHQPFLIFNIIRYNKEQWEAIGKSVASKILSQTDQAVLVCEGCCEKDGDFYGGGQFDEFQNERCKEAPQIIATFKSLE